MQFFSYRKVIFLIFANLKIPRFLLVFFHEMSIILIKMKRREISMYHINFHNPIHIYFIGIGGISMSGLAEILLSEGFRVSGSDRAASPLTEKLKELGATIYYGQREENLTSDIEIGRAHV